MKIADELYAKLITDTSPKGKLFNDILFIIYNEPEEDITKHDEWEVLLLNKINTIKNMVTMDEN